MKDEDLRDLFAGLALTSRAWVPSTHAEHAKHCYAIADAMIEAKYYEEPEEPEVGITAIKTKRKTAKEK